MTTLGDFDMTTLGDFDMTTLGDFEEMKNFFSSYFHEDWSEKAKNPAQVISVYLAEKWDAEELCGLAEQIRLFMTIYTDDEKLERVLFSEMGCYYQPSADQVSARIWLQDVASTLEAAAEPTEL